MVQPSSEHDSDVDQSSQIPRTPSSVGQTPDSPSELSIRQQVTRNVELPASSSAGPAPGMTSAASAPTAQLPTPASGTMDYAPEAGAAASPDPQPSAALPEPMGSSTAAGSGQQALGSQRAPAPSTATREPPAQAPVAPAATTTPASAVIRPLAPAVPTTRPAMPRANYLPQAAPAPPMPQQASQLEWLSEFAA
eukprot:gb/GFBE01073522.1/.p1 GENE.gb/GFBE01073522.1/~~gb/GFBE01073522.1/.p1  ORF type:complete len:194 (+),score=29.85 gb/GFBE01073522.1/:1-582(+)